MFKYLICNRHGVFLKKFIMNFCRNSFNLCNRTIVRLQLDETQHITQLRPSLPESRGDEVTSSSQAAAGIWLLGSMLSQGTILLLFLTNEQMTKAQCPYTSLAISQEEFWIYKSQILIQDVLPLRALPPKCRLSALNTHTHFVTSTKRLLYKIQSYIN